MTEAAPFWLDDMFDADTVDQIHQAVTDAVGHDGELGKLAASLPMLPAAAASAVKSALHVDVLGLLADGWCTAKAIRAYKKPDKAPAGTTSILELGEHSIERDIKPTITVKLGQGLSFPLDIALTVKGAFQGIKLSIRDAHLISVGSGACKLSAQVKVAGRGVHDALTLKTIELPGEYVFRTPLAIP